MMVNNFLDGKSFMMKDLHLVMHGMMMVTNILKETSFSHQGLNC
jgi:hypothetical protein